LLQPGHVLEDGDPRLGQDAVGPEVLRRPGVDARRVDAHGGHLALDQPAGQLGRDAGEVQMGHRLGPGAVGAQVAGAVAPVAAMARADQHDAAGLDRLPGQAADVGCLQDATRRHQARKRNRVGADLSLGEVDRRIQVRAAVFGRAEAVGRVPPAAVGVPREHGLEDEALLLGGPEDRLRVEGVGQVDEPARQRIGGLAAGDQCGHQDDECAHRARRCRRVRQASIRPSER
jgi:hypothetical protein